MKNKTKCYCGHTIYCDCNPLEQPKLEIIEEVAHSMLCDYGIKSMGDSINVLQVKKLMIKMVKWQQEQDKNRYSEEDLREAFRQGEQNISYSEIYGLDSELTEQQWFEKFKKK